MTSPARQVDDESENRPAICVTGATSLVAAFLLPRLSQAGFAVHAVSRSPCPLKPPAATLMWHRRDIAEAEALSTIRGAETLIHLAPIWLLPPRIEELARGGIRRVIAFGSTSRFTKADSPAATERRLAVVLSEAEDRLTAACNHYGVAWTIFRPTLTYGGGRDQNVAFIARFIARFGFFPLAGAGCGKRQPVHADDLAAACLAALDRPAARNRAYNLSGGQELTYREMVEIIFHAQGRAPRIVRLPLPLWRAALQLVGLWTSGRGIGVEMVARMNTDMLFDHGDAQRDFGFAPRPFCP
jgi:nucleoside-diphosphate-sugar epimerase